MFLIFINTRHHHLNSFSTDRFLGLLNIDSPLFWLSFWLVPHLQLPINKNKHTSKTIKLSSMPTKPESEFLFFIYLMHSVNFLNE